VVRFVAFDSVKASAAGPERDVPRGARAHSRGLRPVLRGHGPRARQARVHPGAPAPRRAGAAPARGEPLPPLALLRRSPGRARSPSLPTPRLRPLRRLQAASLRAGVCSRRAATPQLRARGGCGGGRGSGRCSDCGRPAAGHLRRRLHELELGGMRAVCRAGACAGAREGGGLYRAGRPLFSSIRHTHLHARTPPAPPAAGLRVVIQALEKRVVATLK